MRIKEKQMVISGYRIILFTIWFMCEYILYIVYLCGWREVEESSFLTDWWMEIGSTSL